jgi:Cap4 dsDNA endonuclease
MQPDSTQLENLIKDHYHGAVNIRGIKFQLLYSLMRLFDLYDESAPESISLEAIEDVDVNGIKTVDLNHTFISNQYIQVKTSTKIWHWSNFKEKGIIENFLKVWKLDKSAEFLFVYNFECDPSLNQFIEFCNGINNTFPQGKKAENISRDIKSICKNVGFDENEVSEFVKKVKFLKLSETEILEQIRKSVVKYFDLQTNNTNLYILSLTAKILNWAVERYEIKKLDLEQVKIFIQDEIDKGTTNLAVQNGWIEKLEFQSDKFSNDYYEGANARPEHILAGLDVNRPDWIKKIQDAVEETGTCIIRTASGQGKSTLLYRYAYQNYQPETTFIIKNLSDEKMVYPIKQSILTRKTLGLPILVLIDNVQANLQYWYRLISELSEHKIHFIVTLREEDWFRYSGDAGLFKWKIITPELSLDESRQIFNEFNAQNKIADGIDSAEWAFEQVAERKLLLEFTYLITHGHMLNERLQEQVHKIQRLNEDKAKLHILRLVSVAQKYEAKLTVQNIVNFVNFEGDPNFTLESLKNEYLLYFGEYCEGLHFVRSQHLVEILHSINSIEETMKELIQILDDKNLSQFVASAFSNPEVKHEELLEVLFERCKNESLETVAKIVEGLFTASERVYFIENKHLFDKAKEQIGSSGVYFLAMGTMPFMPYNFLEDFHNILGDKGQFGFLVDLQEKFSLRQWEDRIEVNFLQKIVNQMSDEILLENFDFLGEFLDWCRLPEIDISKLTQQLSQIDWSEKILSSEIKLIARFLLNLFHYSRDSYNSIIEKHKIQLQGRFKLLSDTILLEERNEDIFIEFIVDESSEKVEKPHEQASSRLNLLYELFPYYEHYCSNGLYSVDFGVERFVDDTIKRFPLNTLELGLNAHKNNAFQDFVNSFYATTIIHQWQKQHFELRKDFLKFIEKFIEILQNGSMGKSINIENLVVNEYANVYQQFSKLDKLPNNLGDRIQKAESQINSWSSDINIFLSQVFQQDENSNRLCIYNLREAAKKLTEINTSFKIITDETQPYFDFSILEYNEKENCFLLAEMLDILYNKSDKSPIKNFRAYIEKHRKVVNDKKLKEIKYLLKPLEDDGFKFTYSKELLVDGNDLSIIIGFEVNDFRNLFGQMERIIVSLASLSFDYWYLHLVPLLNGNTYQPTVWRISQSSMKEIVLEGKTNDWALLPLQENKEVFSFIPNNQPIEILESILIMEFNALSLSFHVIRRTKDFLIHN